MKISIVGLIVGIAAIIFFGTFIICAMIVNGDIVDEKTKNKK